MRDRTLPSGGLAPHARRSPGRGYVPAAATFAAIIGIAHVSGFMDGGDASSRAVSASPALPGHAQAHKITTFAGADFRRMLSPVLSFRSEELRLRQDIGVETGFRLASVPADTPIPVIAPVQEANATPPAPAVDTTRLLADAPLPTPRPSDLKAPDPARTASRQTSSQQVETQLVPSRQVSRIARSGNAPAASDNRSFFEKFFNVQQPPGNALAYAAPGADGMNLAPTGRLSAPNPAMSVATAVYNISAGVVHMPNGEKLEAHSGLREYLDDTRAVHMRMRGPTPPGVYDLKEREALFHGVRAIRLNPVGGSAAVHGRSGLLAHTYMLGPNGDSNGCVSFKNYERFLQAYLRGEVRRLVVVTGHGDALPNVASGRPGGSNRRIRTANGA